VGLPRVELASSLILAPIAVSLAGCQCCKIATASHYCPPIVEPLAAAGTTSTHYDT
jgi:hypothetical protein